MPSDLFKRIGEALYGPRWQSEIARDLDVSDRTVRRWVAGDVPDGVWRDLRKLCRDRAGELDRLIAALHND